MLSDNIHLVLNNLASLVFNQDICKESHLLRVISGTVVLGQLSIREDQAQRGKETSPEENELLIPLPTRRKRPAPLITLWSYT